MRAPLWHWWAAAVRDCLGLVWRRVHTGGLEGRVQKSSWPAPSCAWLRSGGGVHISALARPFPAVPTGAHSPSSPLTTLSKCFSEHHFIPGASCSRATQRIRGSLNRSRGPGDSLQPSTCSDPQCQGAWSVLILPPLLHLIYRLYFKQGSARRADPPTVEQIAF